MKLCRFDDDRLGVVLGEDVVDVSAAVERLPVPSWPLPSGDPLFGHLDALQPTLERLSRSSPRKPLSQVKLKSPVATPSKLMAAPVNYRAPQAEALADAQLNFGADIKTIEHYGMFLKSPSAAGRWHSRSERQQGTRLTQAARVAAATIIRAYEDWGFSGDLSPPNAITLASGLLPP
jgi:hypothetical protein